jgi:hypothetical protein
MSNFVRFFLSLCVTAACLAGVTADAQDGLLTEPTSVDAEEERAAEPLPTPRPARKRVAATATGSNQLRDPFWPVGWSPQVAEEQEKQQEQEKKEATTAPPKWDLAIKQLIVKGVVRTGDAYVAMVGDQIVREKERVSVNFQGKRYRWEVRSITRRGVRFEPLDVTD